MAIQDVCKVYLVVLFPRRTSTHDIFQQLIVTDGNVEVIDVAFPLSSVPLRASPILYPKQHIRTQITQYPAMSPLLPKPCKFYLLAYVSFQRRRHVQDDTNLARL